MTVDRINYQKVFPLGAYVNERIGMEAQLQDGDIYEDCLNELKKEVESFHRNSNPQLYEHQITVNPEYAHLLVSNSSDYSPPIEQKTPKELQIQLHIDSINGYKNAENLIKNYGLTASKEQTPQSIKEAYNKRLSELNK